MASDGKKAESAAKERRDMRPGLVLLAAFFLCLGAVFCSPAMASRLSRENTYSAVLALDPGNLEALQGRVDFLRSEGSYLEAASLLRAARAGKRRGAARVRLEIMEARFLAWGKDYDGAIALYRSVLLENANSAKARRGLARVLGWKGLYEKSIAQYRKVLKKNPADIDARLGLARVLAWKGDYRASVAEYRKILTKDTSNKEARLGLGRTLWWSGDRSGAYKELGTILDTEPGNSGARLLLQKIRAAKGPVLSLDFAVSDDSDSNHLEIYKAGGFYSPMAGLRLNLVFSQFEASRFFNRARAGSLGLRASYSLDKKTTISSRIVFLSLDTPDNPTSEMTGGVSFRRVFYDRFKAGAGYSHYALLDTAQLIGNNIRVDEFSAYIAGKAVFLDFTTGVKYGDYSDGNARKDFFIDISRNFEYYGIIFTAGYRLDYRDFSDDLNSGYFDPSGFFAHTFYGRARGSIFDGRIEFDALAAGGVQSFNSRSESTTKLSIGVLGHLTDDLSIRGGAKYARSALASASGFRYEEYKAGLDYHF